MTLKQIAQSLATPESTVRIYRDEFEEFLPAVGEGRRRRYDATSLETLKRIIEQKKSGVASANIRQQLARAHVPQERRRATTQEDRIAAIHQSLEAQGGEIASLRAEVGVLREEIGRLIGSLRAERDGGHSMEAIQRVMIGR